MHEKKGILLPFELFGAEGKDEITCAKYIFFYWMKSKDSMW